MKISINKRNNTGHEKNLKKVLDYFEAELNLLYSGNVQAKYDYYIVNYDKLSAKEKEHLLFIQKSRKELNDSINTLINKDIPSKTSTLKKKLIKYAPIGIGVISLLLLRSNRISKGHANYGGGKTVEIGAVNGNHVTVHS